MTAPAIPVPIWHLQQAVRTALAEDLGTGDITTHLLIPEGRQAQANILAREPLRVAGLDVARFVFEEIDPTLRILASCRDGDAVQAGTVLLTVEGQGRSLLTAERVALNFLQHLSGIATLTSRFCEAVRGYPTKILDTRKTLSGLRVLQKWAVRLGGGMNHRFTLSEGILIKDNHVALLQPDTNIAQACRLAKEQGPHGLRVCVEVESVEQIPQALEGGADVILLDNMTADQVKEAVEIIKGRALIEVSGGITLETVQSMAAAGADFISIGALTHSAPAVDISLECTPIRLPQSHPQTE